MKKRQVTDKRKKFMMELLGDPLYQPMRIRELGMLLDLSKPERKELYEILEELIEEGLVSVDKKGRYSKINGKRKQKAAKEKELLSKSEKKDKRKHKNEMAEEPEGIAKEGIFIGHHKGFGFVEIEGEEGFKHLDEYSDSSTERGKAMRKAICEKFKFESLEFQSLEGLIESIGLEPCKLCTYCWNGKE